MSLEPCLSLLDNWLRHAISQHASARVPGLGAEYFLLFSNKTNVPIDSTRFRVTFSFCVHKLLLGKSNQQLVGVLAVAQAYQVHCVDLVQDTAISLLRFGSDERVSVSRFWIAVATCGALARRRPSRSMVLWFAPSVSSTVA